MADPILAPETPGAEPVDPFLPGDNPLLSEQISGEQRPGGNFEERALRQIRGTGPHVTTGGKVDKLIGTAGRMNMLQHGQSGPELTSGEAQRQQLLGARTAREDPYRDTLHYRQDFGVPLSDTVHKQATAQQAQFKKDIAATNKQLDTYAGQLAADKTRVSGEYQTGQQSIEQGYQTEMDKLGDPTTLSAEYNDWLKNENHFTWVYSGSGPENEGQEQGAYKLTPEQLGPFLTTLVNEGGMKVWNNRIYVNGRGQEVHDELTNSMQRNKVDFYTQAAPAVAESNRNLNIAKTVLGTQRNELLGDLQQQYSDRTTEIAAGEGAIQGRREGIQMEVQANKSDLAEVRENYQERLGRIDETLASMVQGGGNSRSEATPMRQLDSRMPSAQQEQPA